MTSLDDRKNAFEKKFAHDEELRFKATVRRNRLFGLWAAELLGKTGDAAKAYAGDVVAAGLSKGGEETAFDKVRTDLAAGGVPQDDEALRLQMSELLAVAADEIQKS